MPPIKNLKAREILDSRGNPTVEVSLFYNHSITTAAVPSGASTGIHEALELRDYGKRFLGKGVQKAINNVEKKIFPKLKGIDCRKQQRVDNLMLKLDGTKNKSKLGANAILGVSLANARAGAESSNLTLFEYINKKLLSKERKLSLPRPFFNVINGGKHADNNLSIQEFMIVPQFNTFKKNYQVGSEVYHVLKKDIHKKYGRGFTNVGDEGGFAPQIFKHVRQALTILNKAILDAGYKGKVKIALDCGASEFYSGKKYTVDGKKLSKDQLLSFYLELIKKYPIISIEDPFHEDDFKAFAELRKKSKIQVVADDLTVTNPERIKKAIKEKSCNCLLLKVNQIGTLTEALQAAELAFENGWKVMVSHRSGETEDNFIADLAVALGCGQIKSGAPCRGERTAKYNQLLRIEEFMRENKNG